MSNALQAEIERLRAENAALKSKPKTTAQLTVKVSKAGAISVYGMGKFPLTLYKEQWARVFKIQGEIEAMCALPEEQFTKLQAEAIVKAEAREAAKPKA